MNVEDLKKIGDKVKSSKPYISNLITELFFKDPEELLKSIPSVYEQLQKDPGFEEKIREVVERHKSSWTYATRLDIYDASISAAQLASLAVSYGLSLPIERIAEILEALPKLPYIYSYSKEIGWQYGGALALYELLTLLDPTNIMDIFPAYRAAELYKMYKELKNQMK
ncbi:MAG: hypothetical protein QXM68_01710 [Candidatus Aenigmatarchaeota archaeon]|nr:hypothetical protein [Candidatus Aenigmarchaeota archaeon]